MEAMINKTLEQLRALYGISGGILVAVKDGKCILKHCFGEADAEQHRPVDNKTLFQIASCSKAFTTMIAAQLCDEGKMTWDTPVKKLMPEFRMVDKYAEENITPRDMACHRSGLCRHDAMRTYVREDRADLVRRIAYFPPAFGFREQYSYQNQMYVALGHICEKLSGKTWEELLTERIGAPLGMDLYYRGHCDITALNAALPYAQKDGKIFRINEVVGQASNPCGGVYTNADSLEKWLYMLCNHGELNGKRIVSEEGFSELIKPNVVVPGKSAHPQELQKEYALAWTTAVYKGHPVAFHSGSTNGFESMVGFFPEENAAYALSISTEGTPAYSCFSYLLRDILLDDLQDDYSFLIDAYHKNRGTVFSEKEQLDLPLSSEEAVEFCGNFYNPGYGMLEFVYENQHLTMNYGLTHEVYRRISEREFIAHNELSGVTYRCSFNADGCPSINFVSGKPCPIFFEKAK